MRALTLDTPDDSPDWDETFPFEFTPYTFQRAFDSPTEQVPFYTRTRESSKGAPESSCREKYAE